MRRLLWDEARLQARAWADRPALSLVLAGVVAAAGVHVALGAAYPGPVAPALLRWGLTVAVLVTAVGLAVTAPASWRQLRGTVRWGRAGATAVLLAGAVSLVKVGLHDTTPGPVLPASGRWLAVGVLVGLALGLSTRTGASR